VKGTYGDDNVVASRRRLDSHEGVRGAVTEKAGCCVFLAYGSMAKMEAADAGAAGMGRRGRSRGPNGDGRGGSGGVGRGSCVRTRASFWGPQTGKGEQVNQKVCVD
jgi:hypothetical protein